jgi:1-acyl-sn-glycerol-3-phosphate acyltransferase
MSHARAILRLVALGGVTGFAALVHLKGNLLVPMAPTLGHRLQRWSLRTWGRGVCAIARAEVSVEGDPPSPPFLLVCNHLSYFDVVVLASQLHAFFVAKSEVAEWPVVGCLAAVGRTIFVRRGQRGDLPKVVEKMQQAVAGGFGVVFFPEGTSSKGETVLPFKASLFEAALALNCPVSCASLSYATRPPEPPAHLAVCWWGDMTFLPHLYRLMQVRSFSARLAFHSRKVAPTGRKEMATTTHELVEAGFVPVVE